MNGIAVKILIPPKVAGSSGGVIGNTKGSSGKWLEKGVRNAESGPGSTKVGQNHVKSHKANTVAACSALINQPAKKKGSVPNAESLHPDAPQSILNHIAGGENNSPVPMFAAILQAAGATAIPVEPGGLQKIENALLHAQALQAKSPQVQVPQAKGPQIQVPQAKGPQIQVPQARGPQIQVPQARGPQIQVPQARGPQIQVPQATANPSTPDSGVNLASAQFVLKLPATVPGYSPALAGNIQGVAGSVPSALAGNVQGEAQVGANDSGVEMAASFFARLVGGSLTNRGGTAESPTEGSLVSPTGTGAFVRNGPTPQSPSAPILQQLTALGEGNVSGVKILQPAAGNSSEGETNGIILQQLAVLEGGNVPEVKVMLQAAETAGPQRGGKDVSGGKVRQPARGNSPAGNGKGIASLLGEQAGHVRSPEEVAPGALFRRGLEIAADSPWSKRGALSGGGEQIARTEIAGGFRNADMSPGFGRSALPVSAVNKITEAFRASAADGGRGIVIRLEPPELGKVRIILHTDGKDVRGAVAVDNPKTLLRLQREAPMLLERLADAGIHLRRMDMSMSDRQSGDGQAFSLSQWGDGGAQQKGAGEQMAQGSSMDSAETSASGLEEDLSGEVEQSTLQASGIAKENLNIWI